MHFTSSRRRFFDGPTSECHFCDRGVDSLAHIYEQCHVVSAARCRLFNKIIPNSFNCLAGDLPHEGCTNDFPLSSSFLCDIPQTLIIPTLIFNFAVWKFRPQALACKEQKDPQWIVNKIAAIGCLLSTSLPHPHTHKTHKHSSNVHDSTIAGLPGDALICYTDGSATPNPGPCGAGITIFDPGGGLAYDGGLSLGHGSNNIGELAALGACLKEISTFPGRRTAVIFTDSEHAISMATTLKLPKKNAALIKAVREHLTKAKSKHDIELCWIKGHINIPGNTRVDALAKHHAALPGSLNLSFNTSFNPTPWPHGPRLDLIPSNLFVSP